MTCTAEVRGSPDFTDEEVRRRLAACYRLLLDLAEKHKINTSDDGCENQPDVSDDQPGAGCQEPDCTQAEPDTNVSLSGD